MRKKMRRSRASAVALAFAGALFFTGGTSFVLAPNASAGVCTTPGCGGEISNNTNTNHSIRITNCWKDEYGWEEEGDKLSCVTHPGSWNSYNADAELPRGDESKNHYYYYDTDAIRFYRGCVTTYHTWGLPKQVIDRRGKASLWRKIDSLTHGYVDSIVC
jgi:hypothetical protein